MTCWRPVQSATIGTTSGCCERKSRTLPLALKHTASLLRHWNHQFAVKSINIVLPCSRRSIILPVSNASQLMPYFSTVLPLTTIGACLLAIPPMTTMVRTSAPETVWANLFFQTVTVGMVYLPYIHRPRAPISMAARTMINASWLVCAENIHNNQMAVANMGKDMNCLKVSIHAPGLGSFLMRNGKYESSKYGSANPIASMVNTRRPVPDER